MNGNQKRKLSSSRYSSMENQVATVSSTTDSGPLRVLLLINTSGSMKPRADGGWNVAIATGAFAMDSVPLSSKVGVNTFAERLSLSRCAIVILHASKYYL